MDFYKDINETLNDRSATSQTLSPFVLSAIGILTPAAIGAAGTFLHWWFFKREKGHDHPIYLQEQNRSSSKLNQATLTQQQSSSTTNVNVIVSTQPTTDSPTSSIVSKRSNNLEDPAVEIPGGATPLLFKKQ